MTRKLRWRYYCGYCKKGGGSASAMATHEKHCTMNPARICRMCVAAELEQIPVARLIDAIGNGDAQGMKILYARTDCPACKLAALRQSGLRPASTHIQSMFDYRGEVKKFWRSIDEDKRIAREN